MDYSTFLHYIPRLNAGSINATHGSSYIGGINILYFRYISVLYVYYYYIMPLYSAYRNKSFKFHIYIHINSTKDKSNIKSLRLEKSSPQKEADHFKITPLVLKWASKVRRS